MPNGILNLLKPPGLTSHDAVQEVRRIFGERRVGHAGTLDPGAAGVLVVCLGEATKAVAFMEEHDKEYRGEAVFGWATFTQDGEGEVVEAAPAGWTVEAAAVARAAEGLTGEVEQAVPLVSAVHLGGERLYALARRGETVVRPIRRVNVSRFSVEELLPAGAGGLGAGARVRFAITCSRGTYVRALVDEWGRALGGRAYLDFLLRVRSGPFRLEEAVTLEEVAASEVPAKWLLPVEAGLPFPAVVLPPGEAERFGHGVPVRQEGEPAGLTRVYGPRAETVPEALGPAPFLGVGEVDEAGIMRPRRLFGVREERG